MKKKWVIPVIAVLVVIVALAAMVMHLSEKDDPGGTPDEHAYSAGRYIRTENGVHMILLQGSPVVMSGAEELFEGLSTGDEIHIRHGLIRETYPGGTDVTECVFVAAGSLSDIPREILESICPMGYVPVGDSGMSQAVYVGQVVSCGEGSFRLRLDSFFEQELDISVPDTAVCVYRKGLVPGDRLRVECSKDADGNLTADTMTELIFVQYEHGYGNMGLTLEAGWDSEILPYSDDADCFGIAFWPQGQTGKIKILFYPYGDFGVCGTGLSIEKMAWSMGLEACVNSYEGMQYWSFISFEELPGTYIIQAEGVSDWTQEQMDQAMVFLREGTLAEGILRKNTAMEYARRDCGGEGSVWRAYFDYCTGCWSVGLRNGDTQYSLVYSAQGELLEKHDYTGDIAVPEKPVIYLYPQEQTRVSVKLDFDGKLTSTYPKYETGWDVIANPDGTLTDPVTGREYYCLFWEGITDTQYDFSKGFCVSGENTVSFLEDALRKLGLTDREANEFIIYWAPRMEGNAYNLISFQWEAYTRSAVLEITPEPDTLIRVFMAYKPIEYEMEIEHQELTGPERVGFTVVEWGAAEVRQ